MATVKGYEALQRRFAAISSSQGSLETMKTLGNAAVREQKLLVHRKTGNTGRTIHVASVSPTSVVTSAGGAAIFLEAGTKAHTITPNARKALAWAPGAAGGALRRLSGATRVGVKASQMVFATLVHHPGTKPYPFMVPGAVKAAQGAGLASDIVRRWNEAT